MTEDARERFLREITAQVPADRIAEVHLFRPLRRGATETGVAVIAAERADVAPARESGEPDPMTADGSQRTDRHTVFTARYRLTRKGAERGKWEFEVVADADAPLASVDSVVRGVQRRAGDDDEPERLTADGVRAALDGPPVAADGVIDAFRAYLREHNLPVTAQRLVIADIILGAEQHLSAEEIMIELGARGATVGTATVYRTLEVLMRSGLVIERDFGEGFKRFEAARGVPNHEHLMCTVCGRVTEFRDERLARMTMLIAEQHGHLRQGHRLVISGICSDCRAM